MINLSEIKEWLRIDQDYSDDDNLLNSLIFTSKSIIKAATGIPGNYFINNKNDNEDLENLYQMVQRIIITDLYNEKSVENKALTSLYIQLELEYKKATDLENAEA